VGFDEMNHQEYLKLLEFSDEWLRLGILTENELIILGQEYEISDDKHTEHHRYGFFRKYLISHRPLSSTTAENLYDLGRTDPDPGMGHAMMEDIVSLPECPEAVHEKALASGDTYIVKAVVRNKLLKELNSGFTDDLFAHIIASRDDFLQRQLLERVELTRAQIDDLFAHCLANQDIHLQRALLENLELSQAQLEQLAALGSSRAVRNIAKDRLGRRSYYSRRK
jgi:hypothetical protein